MLIGRCPTSRASRSCWWRSGLTCGRGSEPGPDELAWLSWLLPLFAGLAAGLALLSKFNGFLALMIIGIWSGAAVLDTWTVAGRASSRSPAVQSLTGIVALALFVALNPFMTARPTGGVPAQLQLVQKQLRPDLIAELAAVSKLNLRQRFRILVDQRLAVAKPPEKNVSPQCPE